MPLLLISDSLSELLRRFGQDAETYVDGLEIFGGKTTLDRVRTLINEGKGPEAVDLLTKLIDGLGIDPVRASEIMADLEAAAK